MKAQSAHIIQYTDCISAWHPINECPDYDIKQSDCKASVMLELWGMQSIPSLLSLPGPLWTDEVAPDRVLSMS